MPEDARRVAREYFEEWGFETPYAKTFSGDRTMALASTPSGTGSNSHLTSVAAAASAATLADQHRR